MRNIQLIASAVLVSALYTGAALAEETAPATGAAKPEVKDAVLSDADGRALLKKNNCLACHSMDKKLIGPAYKDVAAKYRDQEGVEEKLIAKVSKGGAGSWGSMPMPAQTANADDIKTMVRFILAQK